MLLLLGLDSQVSADRADDLREGLPVGNLVLEKPLVCVRWSHPFQPARVPWVPREWKRPQGRKRRTCAPRLKSLTPARGNGHV